MSNIKGLGHGHGHGGPHGVSQDSASGRGVGLRGDGPPGLRGDGPPGLRPEGPPGQRPDVSPGAGTPRPGGADTGKDPLSQQISQLAQTLQPTPTEAPRDIPRPPPQTPPGLQQQQSRPESQHALLNTDAQLRGETNPVQRPVQNLVPDLNKTQTLNEVRERFSTDFALLKRQVVDVPHLPAEEKANRAFQFFTAYAARFVAVATGQAQDLPPNPHPEAAQKETFQREAPVQATGEESQLWDEGEQGEGEAEGPQVGGRLGKLLDKATRGAREDGTARQGQGRQGGQSADVVPFGKLAVPDGLTPQVPQHEVQSELQAFTDVLHDLHFEDMRDPRTGKDGLQLAKELLSSKSVNEFERKAEDVHVRSEDWAPAQASDSATVNEDPAAVQPGPEAFTRPKVKKDLGESRPELDNAIEFERMNGSKEPVREQFRVQPWAQESPRVVLQPTNELSPRAMDGDDRSILGRLTNKKLGPNMLWNVFHQLRGEGADSAVEKGEWDKLTFGAICILVLVFLIVIALVAL